MSEFITKKSGLTRAYYTPKDWRVPLPTIQEIINDPEQYADLMQHIALNHKGLNWKFYKFQLSRQTYPIFIFSLAWCSKNLKPTLAYSWQFQKNANKLYRFLEKNHIVLSNQEEFLVETCKNFVNWSDYEVNKKQFINSIIDGLNNYYRNFSYS